MIRTLETTFKRGVPACSPVRASLGCAYAQAGRREDAEKMTAVSWFNPLNQVEIFACLGDIGRIFEALDRRAITGPIRMGWLLNYRKFAVLRGARLRIRRKVGLPARGETALTKSWATKSALQLQRTTWSLTAVHLKELSSSTSARASTR